MNYIKYFMKSMNAIAVSILENPKKEVGNTIFAQLAYHKAYNVHVQMRCMGVIYDSTI